MNILITICARAGSKGCKSKNYKEFLGKPLIFYTLKIAKKYKEKNTKNVTDIVVSSDSYDILKYCDNIDNINTINRPLELSQDDTPKVPVIQHATKHMEDLKRITYDYVIDLDVTSPLRKVADLENILEKCTKEKYDLVFSAVESRRNPYFNMVEIDGDVAYKVKQSDYVCRQQAPSVYDMNASIYCYKRSSLINKLKRITFEGVSGLYEMPDTYVIDIDKEEDFVIMEILVKNYYFNKYQEVFL